MIGDSIQDIKLAIALSEAGRRHVEQVRGLLEPVLDALDAMTRADIGPSTASLRLIQRQLISGLNAAGVALLGAVGDAFDPNLHVAVEVHPGEGPLDTVHETLGYGCVYEHNLVRPARVVVYVAEK